MGAYVNPKTGTKEEFLHMKGTKITRSEAAQWDNFTSQFLVCLVLNQSFSAAAIAYDQRERDAFFHPDDKRPMEFYIVSKSDLLIASNLETYLSTSDADDFIPNLKKT